MIIGISGPTTAGKTTLAKRLVQELGEHNASLLSLDNYYFDKELIPRYGTWRNWEHPRNINFEQFYKDLTSLRNGLDSLAPVYLEGAVQEFTVLHPKKYIVAEGFLLFLLEKIRKQIDVKIFLNLGEGEIERRRLNRSKNFHSDYFNQVILPYTHDFVIPQSKFADLTLSGEDEIEKNIKTVLSYLKVS